MLQCILGLPSQNRIHLAKSLLRTRIFNSGSKTVYSYTKIVHSFQYEWEKLQPSIWRRKSRLLNKRSPNGNVILSVQLLLDALVLIVIETHKLRIDWTNLKYTLFNVFFLSERSNNYDSVYLDLAQNSCPKALPILSLSEQTFLERNFVGSWPLKVRRKELREKQKNNST